MKNIHGGDIYNNKVNMDYSVNINPLGMPDRVKRAMHDAVEHCDRYPDINCDRLRYAVAKDRAEEQLRQKQSILEYHRSQMALARAMTRLRVTKELK